MACYRVARFTNGRAQDDSIKLVAGAMVVGGGGSVEILASIASPATLTGLSAWHWQWSFARQPHEHSMPQLGSARRLFPQARK